MNRLHIPAIVFLLAANSVDLLGVEQEAATDQNSRSEEITEPAEHKALDSNRQKPAGSSTNFTPAEKITVDSAVSFPVDI